MSYIKFADDFENLLNEDTKNRARDIVLNSLIRLETIYKSGIVNDRVKDEVGNNNCYLLAINKSMIMLMYETAPIEIKSKNRAHRAVSEYSSLIDGMTKLVSQCRIITPKDTNELCGIESIGDFIKICNEFNQHCAESTGSLDYILATDKKEDETSINEESSSREDENTDGKFNSFGDELSELSGAYDEDESNNLGENSGNLGEEDINFGENGGNAENEFADTRIDNTNSKEDDKARGGAGTADNSSIGEEDDDDFEDDADFEDAELIGSVNRVMSALKDLYDVGFDLRRPQGVLTKEGMVYLKNNRSKQISQVSLAKVYGIINDCCGGYLVQSEVETDKSSEKLRSISMRRGTTYYPEYHLGNALGITSGGRVNTWGDLERNLRKEVSHILKTEIEKGIDITDIVDALTTGIIISEYDPRSCIKMRVAVAANKLNPVKFRDAYRSMSRELFGGRGEVGRCEQLKSGVVEITIVTDEVAYNGKPLFAYEAVKALRSTGRMPSITNAIIGQDVSGKIMTTNLTSQGHSVTLIGAGQRSGKGVLTLNLVGTVLASGCPMIYLDSKPDMSVILRQIAGKHGIIPAVYDTNNAFGNSVGVGAPQAVIDPLFGLFGHLMYMKVAQMMMVIAHLSMEGRKVFDKTPFFIFDEALAFQQTIKSEWSQLSKMAKDKHGDPEVVEWCKTVVNWGEAFEGALGGTINSQLPSSGVCTIWLFQTLQQSSWNAENAESLTGSFNPFKKVIFSRLSTKWMGRGTFDCENGLSKVKDDNEIKNMVDNRWFAQATSQKVMGREDVKMFKPYLVLNTANNGDSCVEAFKINVGPEVWKVVAPEGHLDPGAGFEGFIELLGEGAVNNMALGRELLNKVMEVTGLASRYNSIEEYIYDASAESFYPLAQLKRGIDTPAGERVGTGSYNDGGGISLDPFAGASNDTATESSIDDIKYSGDIEKSRVDNNPIYTKGSDNNKDEYTNNGYGRDRHTETQTVGEADLNEIGLTPEQLQQVLRIIGKMPVESGINNEGYSETRAGGAYVSPNTDENSIDCTQAGRVRLSPFAKFCAGSVGNTDVYYEKLFQNILNDAAESFRYTSMVTRCTIAGDNMYLNDRMLNLNGIVNGRDNIRFEDILDLKLLFKKFKSIRELDIDSNNLTNSMMQLGQGTPYAIFTLSNSLNKINIHDSGRVTTIIRGSNSRNDGVDRVKQKADFNATCDTYVARGFGDNWKKNTQGKTVWGRNASKSSLKYAGEALGGKKMKPVRGTAAFLYGATIGVVGAVAWGGFNLIKTFRGMWKASK